MIRDVENGYPGEKLKKRARNRGIILVLRVFWSLFCRICNKDSNNLRECAILPSVKTVVNVRPEGNLMTKIYKLLTRTTKALAICLAGAFLAVSVSESSAATVYFGEFPGNDPFPDPFMGSESLAKCDEGGQAALVCSDWEDGDAPGNYEDAFSLTYVDSQSFNWEYSSALVTGTSDPLLPLWIAVKASNRFQVFQVTNGDTAGFVDISNLQVNDISHVSFYNGGMSAVPLPASGLLVLFGLGALTVARRKRT